ncbi:DUF1643 domain-containing protein [Clostridium sardiniense]|uniref:DUF1643 domain-containing protein n=1 Tax=Clostridium sardiniense TaxID=29369 RepID=A0ABS7KYT9_CLOSR|nr:DUF1643 domain-containing protein [Clostridium sardiniense]MBY0755978.1 DUF1643 domain-containing protein [Clostridium sardiniense]MDQ0460731.1 hypothetical protein [Clostridium sardiniense]
MGRCKYPKCIKKNNIKVLEDSSESNCYKISIDVSSEGDTILIISNYPKRIDSRGCSKTFKKILKYLNEKSYKSFINGVNKIVIANLFSAYEVDIRDENYTENLYINNDIIKECISESDIIIAAWGEPCITNKKVYRDRVKDILELIRDGFLDSNSKKQFLRVGDLTKFGYPKNCLAWEFKEELNPFYN